MPVLSRHRLVDVFGLVALVAYIAMAGMSYLQMPALWEPYFAPNSTAYFTSLFGAETLNAARSLFGGPFAVILARWLPMLLVSALAVALIFLTMRDARWRKKIVADRLLRWSLAFGVVCFFAYPLYTQDFWLSAVWGDMITSGLNPYYQNFTPEMMRRLPLDHEPMAMSYGPLWALISAVVMALSAGNVIATALLFKGVLLAAWSGSLLLVDRLMRQVAPEWRALALAIAGWVPLGVTETVAEGHNDVALVLPALLWLSLMLQKRAAAPLALAASILCKYVTAPLFLIDLLHNLRARRQTLVAYMLRIVPAALLAIVTFAFFYRSFAFFDGVRLVDSWKFMRPADAFLTFGDLFGDWIEPLNVVFLAVFPVIAAYQCLLYWRTPDTDNLLRAVLAVMAAVSFSFIGHLWTWYLVWTLPLAALVPRWWLARFVVGFSLLAPFTIVVWWVPEAENFRNPVALILYASAVLWAWFTAPERIGVTRRAGTIATAPTYLTDFIYPRNHATPWETGHQLKEASAEPMRARAAAGDG